jgi:Xaa-Pro aminopeptidase
MHESAFAGPATPFPPSEYEARLRRLLGRVRAARLDGVLLFGEITRLYYTGFDSSNGLLVVGARDGIRFLTDARYLAMAKRRLPFVPCDLLRRAAAEQAQLVELTCNWHRVGYEGSLAASRLASLREKLAYFDEWVDVGSVLAAQRSVKTPREQAALRRAIAANDRMLAAVLRQVSVGMSEWEIRNLVRREADRLGQGESFECIPCVGASAAEPHHHAGLDRLRANQPLLLDLGLKLDHYCADLTRTVCFGRPGALLRDVHRVVLAANRRAVAAIRPGMTGADVDDVARRMITKAGYGRAFTHGLGHSLGLEVHESPSFAPACKEVIRPGMVLTVEPGIYLPGRVGVRIEDVVLVTRSGCEVLSQSPRELSRF